MTKKLKDPSKIDEAYQKVRQGIKDGTYKNLREAMTANGITPNMYYHRLKKELKGQGSATVGASPSIQQLSIGGNNSLLLITSDPDLIQKVIERLA